MKMKKIDIVSDCIKRYVPDIKKLQHDCVIEYTYEKRKERATIVDILDCALGSKLDVLCYYTTKEHPHVMSHAFYTKNKLRLISAGDLKNVVPINNVIGRPITLEDIIVALSNVGDFYYSAVLGFFKTKVDSNNSTIMIPFNVKWQPGVPFEKQDTNLINFLYEKLK